MRKNKLGKKKRSKLPWTFRNVIKYRVAIANVSALVWRESQTSRLLCVETKKLYFPNIDCYIVQKEIDTNREKFDS